MRDLFTLKLVLNTILLSFISFTAFAQFNIGVGTTVKPNDVTIGVQAKAVIGVDENWRFSPSANYYITNDAKFGFDADVMYTLITIADNVNIFPMGGINWTEYGGMAGSDIGINLGVFSNFSIKDDSINIYLEPKMLFSDNKGFIMSGGVLF